jgi:long-chain acyl-CoA synthetase
MSETSQPYLGIISGERRRSHADIADRAGRIAGGLHGLGVRQGDSV